MSAFPADWDERTLDLALLEVTAGLSPRDLDELLARVDRAELAELERVVAAIDLAALGRPEAPPAGLVMKLREDARAHVLRVPPGTTTTQERPGPSWVAWSGWLVAATVLAILALRETFRRASSAIEKRDALIASAPDLVRAAWKKSDDPLAGGVNGEVMWSSTRQEGYMIFRDLPHNDPRVNQYQLWIFDATRVEWEAKPVDGGVFDVVEGREVVVPIDAKLDVREPKLFAVTLEAPGGVVVSKREHLLATASP